MTSISFDRLRRFDGPGYFLGGGFVAGLLLFLAWLAMRPDQDRHALHARENNGGDPGALVAPGRGVLGGITRAGAAGRAGAAISSRDSGLPGEGADASEDGTADGFQADADSMAVGEDVGADAQSAEGAALTDSLLDPPANAPEAAAGASAPGAPLLPYYVEVEVAPGQVQILQLNAESPEHARAILRDFRGDPRVLRGPTTEPLQ